jgi:hypothetical protein
MNRGDSLVERAAGALEQTAQRLGADGGVKRQVAEILAEDAAFLRRMKPSLVRARMKGEAPTNASAPHHGGLMQFGDAETKPKPTQGSGGGGPNPLVVVGAAFAIGVVLAKVIDWRGHAHPRL